MTKVKSYLLVYNMSAGKNLLAIVHILIECTLLNNIRWRHYNVIGLKQLLNIVSSKGFPALFMIYTFKTVYRYWHVYISAWNT